MVQSAICADIAFLMFISVPVRSCHTYMYFYVNPEPKLVLLIICFPFVWWFGMRVRRGRHELTEEARLGRGLHHRNLNKICINRSYSITNKRVSKRKLSESTIRCLSRSNTQWCIMTVYPLYSKVIGILDCRMVR